MPNNTPNKHEKNQPKTSAEKPNPKRDLGKMEQQTRRTDGVEGEENSPSRPTTRLPPEAPLQA